MESMDKSNEILFNRPKAHTYYFSTKWPLSMILLFFTSSKINIISTWTTIAHINLLTNKRPLKKSKEVWKESNKLKCKYFANFESNNPTTLIIIMLVRQTVFKQEPSTKLSLLPWKIYSNKGFVSYNRMWNAIWWKRKI